MKNYVKAIGAGILVATMGLGGGCKAVQEQTETVITDYAADENASVRNSFDQICDELGETQDSVFEKLDLGFGSNETQRKTLVYISDRIKELQANLHENEEKLRNKYEIEANEVSEYLKSEDAGPLSEIGVTSSEKERKKARKEAKDLKTGQQKIGEKKQTSAWTEPSLDSQSYESQYKARIKAIQEYKLKAASLAKYISRLAEEKDTYVFAKGISVVQQTYRTILDKMEKFNIEYAGKELKKYKEFKAKLEKFEADRKTKATDHNGLLKLKQKLEKEAPKKKPKEQSKEKPKEKAEQKPAEKKPEKPKEKAKN